MARDEVEILLVEDDPADVELTLHALQSEHLANRIQMVQDGEEALDFIFRRGVFSDRDPDSWLRPILLDLKLPKLDGIEVLRQIKSNPGSKALPVVILTSSRQEKDVLNGYQLGANSYIQKPVDFEQFRRIVKQLGLYWLLVNQPPPPQVFSNS